MSPLSLAMLLSLDWWVQTPEQSEALQAALDQYWSEDAPVVRVGQPDAEQPGIQVVDGQLIWLEQERRVEQPCPSTVGAQVLLVKSWTQALEPADQGWVPEPELDDFLPDPPPGPTEVRVPAEAQPEPKPSPDPRPDRQRPPATTQLSLSAGVGLQSALLAEPWRLALGGARYGAVLNQGLWLVGDLGGRPRYVDGSTRRLGPQLALGLDREGERGGAAELWIYGGARAFFLQGQAQSVMPSVGLRLRGWGPPVGDKRIGVSLSAQLEGLSGQRSFYEGPDHITTMALATAYLAFDIGRPL